MKKKPINIDTESWYRQLLELSNSEDDIRILNRRLIDLMIMMDPEIQPTMQTILTKILMLLHQQYSDQLDAVTTALATAIYMIHNPDSPLCMLPEVKPHIFTLN